MRLSGEGNFIAEGIRWVYSSVIYGGGFTLLYFVTTVLAYIQGRYMVSRLQLYVFIYRWICWKFCTWAFISVDKANDKREIIFNCFVLQRNTDASCVIGY